MHLHLIQFRVLGRQNYDHPRYGVEQRIHIRVGERWAPSAEDYVTDAMFTGPDGSMMRGYVWHCHMLDHEDHQMMCQLRVIDPAAPDTPMPDMPDMPGMNHDHH